MFDGSRIRFLDPCCLGALVDEGTGISTDQFLRRRSATARARPGGWCRAEVGGGV
jgi:hypothetical protein